MKELFEFMKAHLESKTDWQNFDGFKTIEVFRNQPLDMTLKKERTFPYPACFIEFVPIDVQNYSYGIKTYELLVNLHLSFHDYDHDHTVEFEKMEEVDKWMTGLRNDSPSSPYFSSLITEVSDEMDESRTNVSNNVLQYRTYWRRIHAQNPKFIRGEVKNITVTVGMETGIFDETFDETFE